MGKQNIPKLDGESTATLQAMTKRYQAQTTFYRIMSGVAILLAMIGGYLNYHIDHRTNAINATVNRVTDPKNEAKQANGFLQIEAGIFRLDCDAKAHQLTLIDNDLGGHIALTTLQNECSRIQAAPISAP